MFNLTMLETMDTTKRQRLLIMYDYARANKFCKNKKTFAQLIEMSDCNMSNAMNNDNSNYLTDNLFYKINAALGNVFSTDWLLRGTGEMMANNNIGTPAPTPTHSRITQKVPTQITSYDDDDVEYLKKRIAELEAWNWSNTKLIKLLEKEIEELKKGTATARAN